MKIHLKKIGENRLSKNRTEVISVVQSHKAHLNFKDRYFKTKNELKTCESKE